MGAEQVKQQKENQNFSDYYQNETTHSEREMQYIEKLATKLNQSASEIQLIQSFLELRGYKFSNRLLGKGGTSVVLRAENIANQKIALKILKCSSKEEYLANLTEYRLMKQFNSDHIIKVHEILEYRSNNKLIQFLAMERCLYNLQSQITAGKKMNKIQIYEICLQLSLGLKELHAQNVLHLDIKPGNIVYGFDNKWKFIDLGLSKLLSPNHSYTEDIQGLTKYYCSPEQYQVFYELAQHKIGKQSDIYSLGLVFLEMTGVRIRDEQQMEETKIKRINFEQYFNPDYDHLNILINKMLCYNPESRCNLTQIKNYLHNQLLDESPTTTCTTNTTPIIQNLSQFQVENTSPLIKNQQRSRSNTKLENVQIFKRREGKHQSMSDLSSIDINSTSLSPKKLYKYENNNNNNFTLSPKKRSCHAILENKSDFDNKQLGSDSPNKKIQYPQKLEQIQQIRSMLSRKLSCINMTPSSSHNMNNINFNSNNNNNQFNGININNNLNHMNGNIFNSIYSHNNYNNNIQSQDNSPIKNRTKLILPSLTSSKRTSPTNTITRNFYLQKV